MIKKITQNKFWRSSTLELGGNVSLLALYEAASMWACGKLGSLHRIFMLQTPGKAAGIHG